MTSYRVFQSMDDVEGMPSFQLIGEYEAHDPKNAVRAAVLAMPDEDRRAASSTSFAACASSSWQELTPTVTVETAVTFS